MEKLKSMFSVNSVFVRKVVPAIAVMAVSGAAMAAETTGGTGFDPAAFLDPVVTAVKENVSTILPVVAGLFAVVWSATSGIQIVKKFLSKVTS